LKHTAAAAVVTMSTACTPDVKMSELPASCRHAYILSRIRDEDE
jgi:hypothetical protein